MTDEKVVRTFETGANRDVDDGKHDYEGFLSHDVLARFGAYMHKNRFLRDGTVRDSDNWQKGIPREVYVKSAFRHFMDFWAIHRGGVGEDTQDIQVALCGLMFNVMGYLHEELKAEAKFNSETHADSPCASATTCGDYCTGACQPAQLGSARGVDVKDTAIDPALQNPHTLVWQSDINRG